MDGEPTDCDEIAGALNDVFGTDQHTRIGVSDALSESDEFEFVSLYKFKPSDTRRSYELNAVLSDVYGDTFK
jgi:peptide subunit release factor RF-3